uniref:C-type lectin domain-containing protein n=1 Tax=Acrobeloides nanus TaxID=290746 RepID=A0A914DVG3_9BILA
MLFFLLSLPILTVVSLSVNRPSSKTNTCPKGGVISNYLKTVTSDQVWIGATSYYTSIDDYFWIWSDDRKFSYNNFQDSSLKTPPRNEIAVLFNPTMNGKWTIDDKVNNYTLVCEIPLNGM